MQSSKESQASQQSDRSFVHMKVSNSKQGSQLSSEDIEESKNPTSPQRTSSYDLISNQSSNSKSASSEEWSLISEMSEESLKMLVSTFESAKQMLID